MNGVNKPVSRIYRTHDKLTGDPVTVHLGGAVMVLSKRETLKLAHTLVDAVLSLPKET